MHLNNKRTCEWISIFLKITFFCQIFNMNLNQIVWIFYKKFKDFFKDFFKNIPRSFRNISLKAITTTIKKRASVARVISSSPMVALELFFINNLNMPYWTSSCQWSSKSGTTKLDSPHLSSFLVYNTMPSIFLGV